MSASARLSRQEAFRILEGWKNLVRVERHPEAYDGKIAALSQETGILEISTVVTGEGKKTFSFDLSEADFERFSEPGEWADVFMVFLRGGDWLMLRQWK